MEKHHIYNYPKELAPHQINQIRPEVVGFHAHNPGLSNNTPSRSTMFSSHAAQHLVIDGVEIPHMITGVEVEYKKYTTSDRVPFDARVFQVIERYPNDGFENSLKFNPEDLVIIVNDETGEYDVVPVPYYKSLHPYFGYRNKRSDILDTISAGTRLAENTALGDTPGNLGDFHVMTTNMNVMLASSDYVAEDSVIVAQSALAKFENRVYERRSFSIGMRKFPMDIGNGTEYKGMYDIGEYTGLDGAVAYLREYSEGLAPATMSRSSTRRVNFAFDEAIYARQGMRGRIVDIKVIGNADSISALPEQMKVQFERYRQAYINFNDQLLQCERRIYAESSKKFQMSPPKFSNRLHSMLVTARAICDSRRNHNDKVLQGIMNKNPLDEYYVEMVIEYVVRPTQGGKISGISGDKGVITKIVADHRMPVDKKGRRADIVQGPDGTISRTNYERTYLMQTGASAEDMLEEVMSITGLGRDVSLEEIEYLSDSKFSDAFEFLLTGYNHVNPKFYDEIVSLSPEDKRLHLYECLVSGIVFVRPVDTQKPLPHAVMDLENWRPVCFDTVTHQLVTDGVTEETIEKILIAPAPIILLDKTAEDTLTVATAAHGPFGILIKYNQADKYRQPWKDSPPRTLGEAELRAFIAHTMDPEMAVDMMDRANSPEIQLAISRKFVSSEEAGGIDELIDRRVMDYGNGRQLSIMDNFFQAYGLEVMYVPEHQTSDISR